MNLINLSRIKVGYDDEVRNYGGGGRIGWVQFRVEGQERILEEVFGAK